MLKGLFISEDKFLLERIRTGFSDKKGYEYRFASTSQEAVEISEAGDIAVCALTLSMSVMNGEELTEIVAEDNPECRFIFIYEEENTETAVNLFNEYEMSRIIPRDGFSVEILSEMFDKEAEFYNAEENLRRQARALREKERLYKGSMEEMSAVLNSRVDCYSHIIKLYATCIESMCIDLPKEYAHRISAFFADELNEFVERFIISSFEPEEYFRFIEENVNNTEKQKHFQIIGADCLHKSELGELIGFVCHFISFGFTTNMERYRAKLEIKEGPNALRVDFLIDTRLGNFDKDIFDEFCAVMNELLVILCDKCERGTRDGILQYRLYFVKPPKGAGVFDKDKIAEKEKKVLTDVAQEKG
ncbi:MAG: hypothetical protein IKO16_07600 [Lachnospiraceae bacterium]|nr:hypothetical protein [Lachnospiraceae bacterium]